MTVRILCAAAALMLALPVGHALTEPFTYQGQLRSDDQLAQGEFDFRFELYNAETGGVKIGPANSFGNLQVSGGTFDVELDFGDDAFETGDRWLLIRVRPGANVGAYTELSPRLRIASAPRAQHAAEAEKLVDPDWTESGGVLSHGEGAGWVLINRGSTLAADEYFGVHAETTGGVGVVISGNSGSEPYVGYGVNGTVEAKAEYDGPSGALRVINNNNLALAVTDQGETNLFGRLTAWLGITSDEYRFSTPKTGYVSLNGVDFHTRTTTAWMSDFSNGSSVRSEQFGDLGFKRAYASVSLPHGATVKSMRAVLSDAVDDYHLVLNLYRSGIGSSAGQAEVCSVNTGFVNGGQLTFQDSTPGFAEVDNRNYSYYVSLDSVFTPTGNFGAWPSEFLTYGVCGVVIEYTVDEAS